MKQVKNKLMGTIGELDFEPREGIFIVVCYDLKTKETSKIYYSSLEDLCEEWCDYEEPKSTIKDVWFNSTMANGHFVEVDLISDEEAEKAVEKLKAWKRLKDKGFRFNGYIREHKKGNADITIASFIDEDYDITGDIDLLFGGEE